MAFRNIGLTKITQFHQKVALWQVPAAPLELRQAARTGLRFEAPRADTGSSGGPASRFRTFFVLCEARYFPLCWKASLPLHSLLLDQKFMARHSAMQTPANPGDLHDDDGRVRWSAPPPGNRFLHSSLCLKEALPTSD